MKKNFQTKAFLDLSQQLLIQNILLYKNGPLGPPKVENDLKIKSKSKVRIEGTIENESCSTTRVDPKPVFEPYPDPKNSPLGPKKIKNDLKIKSKSKVRIEKT